MARQILASVVTALIACGAEAIVCALDRTTQRASPWEFAIAIAAIVSMYLPVALVAGVIVGLLVTVLRRVRWLRPAAAWLRSPARIFAPLPDSVANGIAALLALAFFFAAATYGTHTAFTRFNEPWLAAGLATAIDLALAAAALVLFAVLGVALKPLARMLRPVARPILLPILVVIGAALGVFQIVQTYPSLFRTYSPVRVLWLPGIAIVYLIASRLVQRATRARSATALRATAAVVAAFSLGALAYTASTYGFDSRVRVVVEERSVAGQLLLRSYLDATDRDADGFSYLFGGDDCDDDNAWIYPGALDREGDGIDADCFGGDGTPDVGVLGSASFAPVPPTIAARPNVVLLSVDALRPDHLGIYGYDRETSPNIDAFAEEAVRFEDVLAQSSRSIRSIPSMMTGLYPSQIAFGNELPVAGLLPSNQTLAEMLAARGYQTAAVIGTRYFNRSQGFFQGFDQVIELHDTSQTRSAVMDRGLDVLAQLQGQERPFFLWIHLFNVHAPYLAEGRRSRFGEELVDRYDEEIALADEQIGRAVDALEERGMLDDTVVFLASDHGEAFYEHGHSGHAESLYEEEVRSVLMARLPGVEPRGVSGRVGLFDFTPTVLNLVRAPAPDGVPSRSLLPFALGRAEPDPERPFIAETLPDGHRVYDKKSLTVGRYRLHWWVRENRVELYDLEEDPGEQNDIATEDPERRAELLGLLRALVSNLGRPENINRRHVDEHRLLTEPTDLDHRVDLEFQGAFTLLGYDVDESDVRPGGSLTVDFYYRVEEETNRNFMFIFDASPPPDHPRLSWMRSEHYPLHGRYFTTEWREGEILRDRVTISLPEELRPGTTLSLSLTIRDGRIPQPFENGRTRLPLGSVDVPETVTPPGIRRDAGAPAVRDAGADAAP